MEPPPDAPDEAARRSVLAACGPGTGRLGELAAWMAACRATAELAGTPRRPRLVLFASSGDGHRGDDPAGAVVAVREGSGRLAALARAADVGVRIVEVGPGHGGVGVGAGVGDAARPAGAVRLEKPDTGALSDDDAVGAALRVGRDAVDREVDEGADLLVPAALADTVSAPAAVVATLTGREPVAVVGVDPGADGRLDDAAWMRRVVAVRDVLRRSRPAGRDPVALLGRVGDLELAALTGFLVQAAHRRTPVVLDGVAVCAAALLADALTPGVRPWWIAGTRSPDPAARHALEVLGLDPVLDLGIRAGSGTGALAAVPVLRAAAACAEAPV